MNKLLIKDIPKEERPRERDLLSMEFLVYLMKNL